LLVCLLAALGGVCAACPGTAPATDSARPPKAFVPGTPDEAGAYPEGGPGAGCPIFPADNPWNTDISSYPVHPLSDEIIDRIGRDQGLHTDFGQGQNGIPYVIVGANQPGVPINFTRFGHESDPGPYPIPLDAPIEKGLDLHVIAVDLDGCMLYELYKAAPQPAEGRWDAACGAKFDLRTNALRPIGWTAADAAGLPIFAGLVRFDEVQRGEIRHALRFTLDETRRAFVLPATHWASAITDEDVAPMGLRFRLKAAVDISGFSPTNQVILTALKRYGMIVADNGASWFLSGAPHPGWDDEDLLRMRDAITGDAFEVVDTGPIRTAYE
jgi:hypothetical protein